MKKIVIITLMAAFLSPQLLFAQNSVVNPEFQKEVSQYKIIGESFYQAAMNVTLFNNLPSTYDSTLLAFEQQLTSAGFTCLELVSNEYEYIILFDMGNDGNVSHRQWFTKEVHNRGEILTNSQELLKLQIQLAISQADDFKKAMKQSKYYQQAVEFFNGEKLTLMLSYNQVDEEFKTRFHLKKKMSEYKPIELYWLTHFLDKSDINLDEKSLNIDDKEKTLIIQKMRNSGFEVFANLVKE